MKNVHSSHGMPAMEEAEVSEASPISESYVLRSSLFAVVLEESHLLNSGAQVRDESECSGFQFRLLTESEAEPARAGTIRRAREGPWLVGNEKIGTVVKFPPWPYPIRSVNEPRRAGDE